MNKKEVVNKIIIYKSKDGKISLDINFDKETVWMTQEQVSVLFGVNRTVITKHINNIIKNEEVDEKSNVQKMHIPNSDKPVKFYNLDIILAIGYKVNTKKGVEFRKWSSSILKEHIIKGYSINQKRLNEIGLKEFEESILFIKNIIKNKELSGDESKGLLDVILNYSHTWSILQKYDEDKLLENGRLKLSKFVLDYNDSKKYIEELKLNLLDKKETTKLFGQERSEKYLEGIIKNVYQTFSKKDLYPTIEEKASHLLYFIIKDHPFVDGNKRIAAFLFIVFLNKNNFLYNKNGERKINDNALVAITLLIAESNPRDKDLMVELVLNLIIDK